MEYASIRRMVSSSAAQGVGSMIAAEEYAVYTAACRTDLFNWETPGTTFADQTASDRFTHAPLDCLVGLIRYRCLKHPELLADFAAKNAEPWPLEKRFEVANGYQLLSERRASQPDRHGSVFSLSRVGFDL